jgi:hypothetical protein
MMADHHFFDLRRSPPQAMVVATVLEELQEQLLIREE